MKIYVTLLGFFSRDTSNKTLSFIFVWRIRVYMYSNIATFVLIEISRCLSLKTTDCLPERGILQ